MKTARQKFGEVLAFHFAKQHKSDREVSDRCGVPIRDVERWRTGELVPDRSQWKRACQMVSRSLFGVSALHGDALKEQDEERDATVRHLRANNGHKMTTSNGVAVTNYGDKLVEAAIVKPEVPVEEPEPVLSAVDVQRRHYPSQPPGARSAASVNERREYAKSILVQRPAISYRGRDGLRELLMKRFGVGIAESEWARLRDEMDNERIEREVASRMAEQPAPRHHVHDRQQTVVPPAQVAAVSAPVNDGDIAAGVELIIGAIPGLLDMTIKVDDAGVASFTYSVRKVQVTTVSAQLTVRR